MTDLISKLADDIVALNNASPRLPRKEQIEEVLRTALPEIRHPMMVIGVDWASKPDQTVYWKFSNEQHTLTWAELPNSGSYLATQEQLVKAADDIRDTDALAVRRIEPMLSYEAKAKKRCEIRWYGVADGTHNWKPMGFDRNGLFCKVGYQYDISEGTHLHDCGCGASKFVG